jgi:ribonuclease-3
VVGQEGPDHDRTFWVSIALGSQEYGRASGKSKKEAEQSAAAMALARLEGGRSQGETSEHPRPLDASGEP